MSLLTNKSYKYEIETAGNWYGCPDLKKAKYISELRFDIDIKELFDDKNLPLENQSAYI